MAADTVGEYDGRLCIVGAWQTMNDEPTEYRLYWPLELRASDFPEMIGLRAYPRGCGVYSIDGRDFPLSANGRTRSIFREMRPVKRPRWGKSWVDGEWKRY